MLILDTHVLIDFFSDKSEEAEKLIHKFESGELELAVSAITLSEIFYIIADKAGHETAKISIDIVKAQLSVIPVNAEIAEKAGEFKFRYAGKGKKGLPMADAIIAATAWIYESQLITSDTHFDKVKEVRVRRP